MTEPKREAPRSGAQGVAGAAGGDSGAARPDPGYRGHRGIVCCTACIDPGPRKCRKGYKCECHKPDADNPAIPEDARQWLLGYDPGTFGEKS